MPNLAQAAKLDPFALVIRRYRPSIPSLYSKRLPIGSKLNVATRVEELGSTKAYRRSKHLSKRAKVPNLYKAAKLDPFALVIRRYTQIGRAID